jgi:hypothetical protein
MNYGSFRIAVQQEWAESRDLRLGQVYFNLLMLIRPDLAEMLRGSLRDPFYKEHISAETEEIVASKWDDSAEFAFND